MELGGREEEYHRKQSVIISQVHTKECSSKQETTAHTELKVRDCIKSDLKLLNMWVA